MSQFEYNYRAIIADDEANLCSHLKLQLGNLWPELEIAGIAYDGPQALTVIKEQKPDIAFLDIRMPEMNGIQVAMQLQGACHVVFITAYDEYAIQAFEQNAMDYLLKPVANDRLNKTVDKLKEDLRIRKPVNHEWQNLLTQLKLTLDKAGSANYLQWIRVGTADKTILVSVDDVIFFRASDKYTAVMTRNTEHLIRKPIKELLTELDPGKFWQINRGIIVNVNNIKSTRREFNGRCEIYLKDYKEALISSRQYSHLFKQM